MQPYDSHMIVRVHWSNNPFCVRSGEDSVFLCDVAKKGGAEGNDVIPQHTHTHTQKKTQ